MFSKLILSILMSAAVAPFAFADEAGPYADQFDKDTAAYSEACPQNASCQAPYSNQLIYSRSSQINKLSNSTEAELKKISIEQAQIWGDTILEGDYVAQGDTRLDSVLALFKDKEFIGYKIRYSERAWYTGDCNYDGSEQSLQDCGKGRIIEESFVSPDFMTFFMDDQNPASFAFDAN